MWFVDFLRRRQQEREVQDCVASMVPAAGMVHGDLSPAQVERLVMLIERCGEVAVVAGKVLRFGYAGTSPRTGLPNQMVLERKVGGALAMIDLMARREDVRLREVRTTRDWSCEHLGDWAIHQGDEVA